MRRATSRSFRSQRLHDPIRVVAQGTRYPLHFPISIPGEPAPPPLAPEQIEGVLQQRQCDLSPNKGVGPHLHCQAFLENRPHLRRRRFDDLGHLFFAHGFQVDLVVNHLASQASVTTDVAVEVGPHRHHYPGGTVGVSDQCQERVQEGLPCLLSLAEGKELLQPVHQQYHSPLRG